MTHRGLQNIEKPRKALLTILVVSVLVLLLHETYGALFVATSITLVLIHSVFYKWRLGFLLAILQILALIGFLAWVSQFALIRETPPKAVSSSFTFLNIFDVYFRTTGAVVVETLSGNTDVFPLKDIPVTGMIAGLIVNLFAALYVIGKNRNNLIAGMIIFGLGFALSSCLYRGQGFTGIRYIHVHKILALGIVLAVMDYMRMWLHKKTASIAALLLAAIIFISQIFHIPDSFAEGRNADLAEDQREYMMMAMSLAPEENQFWSIFLSIGKRRDVINSLAYMQEQKLNVFSDHY